MNDLVIFQGLVIEMFYIGDQLVIDYSEHRGAVDEFTRITSSKGRMYEDGVHQYQSSTVSDNYFNHSRLYQDLNLGLTFDKYERDGLNTEYYYSSREDKAFARINFNNINDITYYDIALFDAFYPHIRVVQEENQTRLYYNLLSCDGWDEVMIEEINIFTHNVELKRNEAVLEMDTGYNLEVYRDYPYVKYSTHEITENNIELDASELSYNRDDLEDVLSMINSMTFENYMDLEQTYFDFNSNEILIEADNPYIEE